jgi:hypothetical protein
VLIFRASVFEEPVFSISRAQAPLTLFETDAKLKLLPAA